jgi:hypothetical protein
VKLCKPNKGNKEKIMNLNVEKMRQFLEDFRDNDPEFSEKILDAIRDSLSDESIAVLFWKYRNKFLATYYPVMPEAIKGLNNLGGYGFMVPSNWANHCDWITFGKDEDGNEIIMCQSGEEKPYIARSFYELWDTVLDYYDFDIDAEIESIMDYWEKEYMR